MFAKDPVSGELRHAGYKNNESVAALGHEVQIDCLVYAFRIISIIDARDFSVQAKEKQKKELHAAADVEMADASKAGPSIQSMIDSAISARLKKLD
ncbi:hypothetical protein BV22DRAFT_1027295, partial [Leucogyrophana mollusca]